MKLAINGGEPLRKLPLPMRTPYSDDEILELKEAIESQNLFYMPANKVVKFESEFAKLYGVNYACACTSGSASVHTAVAAINLNPGDEVITCPVTDFGTLVGVIYQGLIPIFADWKANTFNVDPDDIERKITDRTKALIIVHLFGNPCDMDAIIAIAKKHNLIVIEDCCQAYMTYYKDKLVGTIGDIGCFSMQQSKHMATGEGGIIITNNEEYAMRMSCFTDKGWDNRGSWGARSYSFLGVNYRMNELTAAVGLAQMRKVNNVVDRMHENGELLTLLINDIKGIMPAPVTQGGRHSYWLYSFKINDYDPEDFTKALCAEGIPASWAYTVDPIYLCTDALKKKRTFGNSSYPFDSHYTSREIEYKEGLCPIAEKELLQIVSIRFYDNWSKDDIKDAADAIRKVAEGINAK